MTNRRHRRPRRDIYQEVTDKILQFIDRGNLPPWRCPILGSGGDGWPKSLSTGKRYRGINSFLLAISRWTSGFDSDYWLTYRQAKQAGAHVRAGERGALVVFWKQWARTDRETGDEVVLPVLRHYTVFNADQCEDLAPPDAQAVSPADATPIAAAEAIIDGFRDPPEIEHAGSAAAYFRKSDRVRIAARDRFVDPDSYYATLFHELAHATGHEKRLNRPWEPTHVFGTESYAKEELVAEFAAAFLTAAAGISPPIVEQQGAYIDGWRRRLREDSRLTLQAASLAQRAADYIQGVTFEPAADS